jgi:hypothetical protein
MKQNEMKHYFCILSNGVSRGGAFKDMATATKYFQQELDCDIKQPRGTHIARMVERELPRGRHDIFTRCIGV